MSFAVWTNDDEATVYLRGEIDVAVVPDVDVAIERALRHTPRVLHLDLDAVTFLDSCGISAIVRCWRRAGPDTTVRLGPAQPNVERVLTLTCLRESLAQVDPLPAV